MTEPANDRAALQRRTRRVLLASRLSSGMIVAATSYSALSAGSSALALVVLAAVLRR